MFQTKRIYRPVNGQELKDIIPARVREAMMLDNTLNVARGFPLLKYEVKVTLTPYRSAGMTREGVPVDLPDTAIVYEVDGQFFTPFEPAAPPPRIENPFLRASLTHSGASCNPASAHEPSLVYPVGSPLARRKSKHRRYGLQS